VLFGNGRNRAVRYSYRIALPFIHTFVEDAQHLRFLITLQLMRLTDLTEFRIFLNLSYLIFIFSERRLVALQSIFITSGQNKEICHNQGKIDEESHEKSETQDICCDFSSNNRPKHRIPSVIQGIDGCHFCRCSLPIDTPWI